MAPPSYNGPCLVVNTRWPLARWRFGLVSAGIGRHGLARITEDRVQPHRLTQAIVRDTQPPEQRAEQVTRVEALLTGMDPGDASDPVSWPGWAQLLPRLHAVDLAATNNRTLHDRACDAIWYLLRSGDTTTGQQLAHHLRRAWTTRLGPMPRS